MGQTRASAAHSLKRAKRKKAIHGRKNVIYHKAIYRRGAEKVIYRRGAEKVIYHRGAQESHSWPRSERPIHG